jgi:hypothetical protein
MKYLFVLLVTASVVFISFSTSEKATKSITASGEQSVDVMPGSSPYLTKDNHGNTATTASAAGVCIRRSFQCRAISW